MRGFFGGLLLIVLQSILGAEELSSPVHTQLLKDRKAINPFTPLTIQEAEDKYSVSDYHDMLGNEAISAPQRKNFRHTLKSKYSHPSFNKDFLSDGKEEKAFLSQLVAKYPENLDLLLDFYFRDFKNDEIAVRVSEEYTWKYTDGSLRTLFGEKKKTR